MINPIFSNSYNEDAFTDFIQDLVPSLDLNVKRAETRTGFKSIQQIAEATENNLDLVVFVAKLKSSLHARVEITKNTYAVLKSHVRSNALVAYISDDSSEWRLSLITTKVTRTKDGIKESVSNPRRFSYVLGPNAKVATPSKMLQGTIDSIIDLENKFSLAVVSKEFFTQIATQYSKLVGGTRGEGRKAMVFERTLKLGDANDAVNANFAIRLIGRLVFCWFLKQKKGHLNNPLIPPEILSVSAAKTIEDYYHSICVPLFFEVLNKPQPLRPNFFAHAELFDKVPFLNGGLFQDHTEDNHKFNRTTGMSERRGIVDIPDDWFSELFQIFEEYNFTIDENTSIDTELSIDPEMLGKVFENLLAEVNPETGASARKSTGSFYTPREIVDFMVEESLIAHLKTKTNISEEKLRALTSYNLDDDASHPIDQQEKKLLVEAIHNTTVLDPACGSGAFPIGVLQRLVHMLGVLDPECSIYLGKIPPEMRRQLQKHSLTYVRKLGVIRECIHGVDIQPVAIDISRLRCFLTLVVDQRVDDNAPNRGIEPLPNLDFKFVCANALIKPPVHEGPLFGDEFATALGELIDEYFAPIDQMHKLETARKLQQLISNKTKKELENILKSYSYLKDEKYKKVLAKKNEKSDTERLRINNLWGSYENIFQNKPVGFFDTRYFFPIVFRKGGFDIVIANPPYIDSEGMIKNNQEDVREYIAKNYNFAKGNWDIYIAFFENGISNLSANGVLAFITPDKWISKPFGEALRKNILKYIHTILNAGRKVFESVHVDSIVTIIEMTETTTIRILKIKENEIKFQHEYCKDKIKSPYELDFLFSDHLELLAKIEAVADLTSKIKFNCENACATSDAYKLAPLLVDLSQEDRESGKYLKIINTGTIGKYSSKWGKREMVYLGSKYLCPGVLKEQFNKEFENSYSKKSVKPKIIIKGLNLLDACLDGQGEFIPGKSTLMISDNNSEKLKLVLAIINCSLSIFYLKEKHPGASYNQGTSFTKDMINKLPMPRLSDEEQQTLIKIVDQILAITKSGDYLENSAKKEEVKEYEKQIDELVYKLYNLTEEEKDIIRKS